MCDKRNTVSIVIDDKIIRVDSCLKNIITFLNRSGTRTVASCCGHGKYPTSILIKVGGVAVDIYSNEIIRRTRNFYRKDKDGFYYIPEVVRS